MRVGQHWSSFVFRSSIWEVWFLTSYNTFSTVSSRNSCLFSFYVIKVDWVFSVVSICFWSWIVCFDSRTFKECSSWRSLCSWWIDVVCLVAGFLSEIFYVCSAFSKSWRRVNFLCFCFRLTWQGLKGYYRPLNMVVLYGQLVTPLILSIAILATDRLSPLGSASATLSTTLVFFMKLYPHIFFWFTPWP